MSTKDLKRGTLVEALWRVGCGVGDVEPGDRGVVFEEAGFYGDGCGPIVRWMSGAVCNVYEGDVKVIRA
jgi:hypothetical protein